MSPFAVDYVNLPIIEPTTPSSSVAPAPPKTANVPSFLDHFERADRSSRTSSTSHSSSNRADDDASASHASPTALRPANESHRSDKPAEAKSAKSGDEQTQRSEANGTKNSKDDGDRDDKSHDPDSTNAAAAANGTRTEPAKDDGKKSSETVDEEKVDGPQGLKRVLKKLKQRGGKAGGAADGKVAGDANGKPETAANGGSTVKTDEGKNSDAKPADATSSTNAEAIVAQAEQATTAGEEQAVAVDGQAATVATNVVDGTTLDAGNSTADAATSTDAAVGLDETKPETTAVQTTPPAGDQLAAQTNDAKKDAANAVDPSQIAAVSTTAVAATELPTTSGPNDKKDRRGDSAADAITAANSVADAVSQAATTVSDSTAALDATLAAGGGGSTSDSAANDAAGNSATSTDRTADGTSATTDTRRDPPTTSDVARPHAHFDSVGVARSTSTEGGSSLSQADRVRLIQRVARAVQTAQERGGELKLRLSPPELGSLRLELQMKDGTLSARIETQTPEAKQVLVDNLPALRERLSEQNIRVERFDVDLSNSGSRGGSPQSFDGRSDSPFRGTPRDANGTTRSSNSSTADASPEASRTPVADGRLNILI